MFDQHFFWATAKIGIFTLAYGIYYYRKWLAKTQEKPRYDLPTYGKVGVVKQIFFYALEGGHPIEVEKTALCLGSGLQCKQEMTDRSFVVYTANNRICYTTSIKLATVCLTRNSCLQLETITDGRKLEIEDEEINKENDIAVNYMNQILQVYDCGDRAALFLSQYLLELPYGLRLGQFAVPLIRKSLNPVDEIATNPLSNQHHLMECMKPEYNNFSLISDKTIDYVKGLRGCEHVTPKHFRAHIVIALLPSSHTPEWRRPFIEDNFEYIKIGSSSFTNVTLRSIDQFVNVDPQTGILSDGNQPFRELQRFRKAHYLNERLSDSISTPVLGINMEIKQTGLIRVGDEVWVNFRK